MDQSQWVAVTQASPRHPWTMLGYGPTQARVEAAARLVIQSFQPRIEGGWMVRLLVKRFGVDHALKTLVVLPAEEAKACYPEAWQRYWKNQESLGR